MVPQKAKGSHMHLCARFGAGLFPVRLLLLMFLHVFVINYIVLNLILSCQRCFVCNIIDISLLSENRQIWLQHKKQKKTIWHLKLHQGNLMFLETCRWKAWSQAA